MKKIKLSPFLIYYILIIYLELITKYIMIGNIFNMGTINMLVLTIPFCLFLTIITKTGKEKVNRITSMILLFVITILYGGEIIYFILFSVPFSISSISMANQALDFISIVKDTLIKYWYYVLAILIPYIIILLINKKIDYTKYNKHIELSLTIMFFIAYAATFAYIYPNKELKKLYLIEENASSQIDNFGMLSYTKIDLKRQVFGYNSEVISNTNIIVDTPQNEIPKKPEEIIYGDNAIDIDFDSLTSNNKNIQALNNYMKNQEPTKKNKYTGKFRGKNLIFILAEGFNEVAVDEERTPTLYKMVNSGFVFKNFYSPVHLSTIGGEFQATTGLVPTQNTLNLWKKKKPTIEYGLGNAFKKQGYRAQSYHNWTYTYYRRNVTMETLGFNNYTGCGNGLEKEIDCHWLPSDIKMVDVTTPKYLGKDGNFVTYYVTVSGHSPYNPGANIQRKYLKEVKGNYSTSVKCYLASQMELDRMLEELINKLKETNELDDTVIALVGDHYPYTLSTDEMNEVSKYRKDGVIEVNHSNFILWNNEIKEPIIIDKLGSQIDVLPTLLNLFGIEYDSRLIVGKDILSDTGCVAIFSNYSWVSDYGTYNSSKRTFTLKEGKTLENQSEYVKQMNNRVSNAYSISRLIIDNYYYNYVLRR